jgi:hypothetical protein
MSTDEGFFGNQAVDKQDSEEYIGNEPSARSDSRKRSVVQ